MPADRQPDRRVDIVAFVAGLAFVLFSVVSLTFGILDLPDFGAAPLWVILIGAGVILLISELRGRKDEPVDAVNPPDSPELEAWEQDPYR